VRSWLKKRNRKLPKHPAILTVDSFFCTK
jgi:hypothetical protein